MLRLLRRILLLNTGVFLIAFSLAGCQPTSSPILLPPTSTPRRETQTDFTIGQCIQVTHPTYLRFGPGLDYPVNTNMPARPQPLIIIIDHAQIGLICADPTLCNLHDEGWWWPVRVAWPDNGDIDEGWLWQGEIKGCR